MRTRFLLPGGILLVVALLLLVGLVAGPTLASPAAAEKKGDPLADSVCANCHGDQVKAFLANPHDRGLAAKGWRVRRDLRGVPRRAPRSTRTRTATCRW